MFLQTVRVHHPFVASMIERFSRLEPVLPPAHIYSLTERQDLSLTVSVAGRLVHTSPALVSLLAPDKVGRTLSDLFPELEPHSFQGTLSRSGRVFEARHQPLGYGKGRLGDLVVLFDITERVAREAHLQALNTALERSQRELKVRGEQLFTLAHTDALTGLHNFRSFETRYRKLLAHSARTGENFSLILWNVDNFIEVNAHFTLLGGNEVLERLAEVLRSSLPDTFGCRLGGEEFAALLPATPLEDAEARIEAVQAALLKHRFSAQGRSLKVGMSAVPASWHRNGEGMFYEACRSLGPIKYGAHLARGLAPAPRALDFLDECVL